VPITSIWYFRFTKQINIYLTYSQIRYALFTTKDTVIQAGIAKMKETVQRLDLLTEEEYLNILDTLPADNQTDDFDPNKFVAKC
jgi:DNA-directed RNA polymerase subunit beta'